MKKEIALIGENGPVQANMLERLLQNGMDVNYLSAKAERVMLDTTNLTISQLNYETKDKLAKQLEGYDTVVIAYETDYTNAENNNFMLRTYSECVNAAINAGVRRLAVVGSPFSEAFLQGELNRHGDLIDGEYISTEGDYAGAVVNAVSNKMAAEAVG